MRVRDLPPPLGSIVIFHGPSNDFAALVTASNPTDAQRRIALRVFAVNPANDQTVANVPQDATEDGRTPGTWSWP